MESINGQGSNLVSTRMASKITGWSRDTLLNRVRAGLLPKPQKITLGSSREVLRWDRAAVEALPKKRWRRAG